MIPSRLFGPHILRVPLVSAVAIWAVLGTANAWGQGQPSAPVVAPRLSEAERARRLQERDQVRARVITLAQAGKLDEAVAAAITELAVTRELRGELHEDVVDSLKLLAKLHEDREDWASARNALTDMLAISERQPSRKGWRIADANHALADLDRRVALQPRTAPGSGFRKADELNGLAVAAHSQGKYADGIDPSRRAAEISAASCWA